jgi:LemA protein
LNQAVKTFPSSLFASLARVAAREFYIVDDPQNRQAPNVKF